jgi:predicted transcriptional regulator
MTTLSIELPPEVYERLRRIAGTRGTSAEDLAQAWLEEKTAAEPAPETMRERMRAALRAHGLLAEPTNEMRRLASESTLTLDEARAILDRAGGKPLSEVILEMRGPKE